MQGLPFGAARVKGLVAMVSAVAGALAAVSPALAGSPAAVSPALAAPSSTPTVGAAPRMPAGARTVGALAGATPMSIRVALEPRDPAALARYATDVSTPGTSAYRHYLTVSEFRARFGPTAAETGAVEAALAADGLRPVTVSANGLLIAVTGTAREVGAAFSVAFRRVALPGGRIAFANTGAPRFDASVAGAIQGVIGLDDLRLARPLGLERARRHGLPVPSAARANVTGPQPCAQATTAGQVDSAYTADQLASAYGFTSLYSAGDLGAGQTVDLFELEPNLASDIAAYQACYGTSATVTPIKVDGGAGTGAGGGEAALDIEDVIGLAPRATIDVYQAPNSETGWVDNWTAIVDSGVKAVVSDSWGACEAATNTIAVENTLFQQAAAEGQSVYAAAGDFGSEDCLAVNGPTSLAVDDPGTQPYVTSVGGTTLTLSPSRSEVVWNNNTGATGGGVSFEWRMPAFQSGMPSWLGVINANSAGSPCGAPLGGDCREVPDVSADADPSTGYVIDLNGNWGGIGGTSAAAPLWAAFTALVNASSACHGTNIGYANPVLYRAAASDYAANFNDTTSGNNDFTGTNGGLYPAGPGYDMASGLGTPVGSSLASALCFGGGNLVTFTGPGNESSRAGAPTTLQIQATDSAGAALAYSASGLPPGLEISSTTGLISGTPTTLGTSTVTVKAVDTTGAYDETSFTWTVTGNLTVTVTAKVNDSATGRAWSGSERAGASAFGTATVTGASAAPTGTVTYSFWSNPACSGAPLRVDAVRIGAGGGVPVSPTVGPLAAASYGFRATYSGDATYSALSGGCQAFAVGARLADLRVAIHGAARARDGSTFTERVTVTNAGPSPATHVITAVTVPTGARIATAPRGRASVASVYWTAGSIATRSRVTYTITLRVSAHARRLVSFAAGTASTQVHDPRYANNAAAVSIALGPVRGGVGRPRDPFALGAGIVSRLQGLTRIANAAARRGYA